MKRSSLSALCFLLVAVLAGCDAAPTTLDSGLASNDDVSVIDGKLMFPTPASFEGYVDGLASLSPDALARQASEREGFTPLLVHRQELEASVSGDGSELAARAVEDPVLASVLNGDGEFLLRDVTVRVADGVVTMTDANGAEVLRRDVEVEEVTTTSSLDDCPPDVLVCPDPPGGGGPGGGSGTPGPDVTNYPLPTSHQPSRSR